MSTSQKIGLASVALICLILIGFYLGQDDPRSKRNLPPAAAVEPVPTEPAAGERPAAESRSALVLPSASDALPPTGLDAIVSRIKNETDATAANTGTERASTLASNTPASVAAVEGPVAERIIPLTEASSPAATGSGLLPTEAAAATTNPGSLTGSNSSDSAIAASPTKTAGEIGITPAPSPIPVDSSTRNEVPSLTLGASADKSDAKSTAPATAAPPASPVDAAPAKPLAKDDPKQFADLPIIDDADPALVRAGGTEPATTTVDAGPRAVSNPLITPSEISSKTDSKTTGDKELVAAVTDPAEKSDAHSALPVSPNIPVVIPKPDANQPAVKPEVAKPAAAPAIAGKPYAIRAGDTFSSIASAVYGAEKHWIEIAEANPQVNPSKLKLGQIITLPQLPTDLPKLDAKAADTKAVDPKAADAIKPPAAKALDATKTGDPRSLPVKAPEVKFHEVKAGENLATISRKHFNTGEHWRHIYVTNREIIGSDPGRLHVGMKLKITEPVKTVN